MSSTAVSERTGLGVQGFNLPGYGTPTVGAPTGFPVGTNWLMVPRCTFKIEKCQGGVKWTCVCDDKMASSMVQNLCTMLSGGLCSSCVLFNGMTVACYNFTLGLCRWETTDTGVCFTYTSGDQHCGQMIQSCADCWSCMLEGGCNCCFLINNTPVCCGTSETSRTASKNKPAR